MNFFMNVFIVAWSIVSLAIVVLLLQYVKEKGWITNWLKKRKEKKEKRELAKDTSKKQIKKHNKRKDTINFDALKFEYSEICTIVNDAAAKADLVGALVSEVYILKFDEYYKKKNAYSDKFGGIYSLESVACLVKALIEEPYVRIESLESKNIEILENVIDIFSNKDVTYTNSNLKEFVKDELISAMQENFRLYGDDVFLVAMYVIERLYK